jgi:hypothetical protein
MAWDQTASNNYIQQQYATIQQNLGALPYYRELKTRGIPSGDTELTKAQGAISDALAHIQAETNAINQMTQEIADKNEGSNVAALSSQVDTLKPQVEKQRTLFQLRTEQATSLAQKYEGNYRSMWWPLWFPMGSAIPLSDSVRVLMYTAAVGLTGTAVVLWRSSESQGSQAPQSNQAGGGHRKKRTYG